MKTSINTILVAAAIASTSVSLPASAEYIVSGVGAFTCGTWTDNKANSRILHMQNESWVTGFVSAIGWNDNRTYEADVPGMTNWINNYCKENPLKLIIEAAQALVLELEK